MNKSFNRKVIIGVILVIAALCFVQSLYHVDIYFEKKSNHEKVTELINNDLVFSWDTMDDELSQILDWIDTGHFYNGDLGRLYERASLIYMQKGETMSYYRYLGYALFYLEQSDDKDYTVNIYLDLANFFLNNYDMNSAKNMVDSAIEIEDFDAIDSLQIKSYAYRMLGMMAILDENYSMAEEYLNKSQDTVDQSNTNIYEETYRAINDTWLARVYVETGRFDECREKLDKWEGHDMFYTDVYREIMLRDLIIPYYQAKCILVVADKVDKKTATREEYQANEKTIDDQFEEFVALCDENGYEKAELNTLLRILKDFPPENKERRENLYETVDSLYNKLFVSQNISYTGVIDNMVADSKAEMIKEEDSKRKIKERYRIIFLGSIAVGLFVLSCFVMLLNSRYDGLTLLLNRKVFTRQLFRCKKSNVRYGVIMMDIDDFKHVNDTYGHIEGDRVLQRLGQLLQTEIKSDVQCFRYGGEEFVILVGKGSLPAIERMAERIRLNMEQQLWEFDEKVRVTLSLGVATGSGDEDVLRRADENLYTSKQNGKNQVTMGEL